MRIDHNYNWMQWHSHPREDVEAIYGSCLMAGYSDGSRLMHELKNAILMYANLDDVEKILNRARETVDSGAVLMWTYFLDEVECLVYCPETNTEKLFCLDGETIKEIPRESGGPV